MKKLFVSALAMLAVALGFTACSSEDELVNETPAQGKQVTVIATTEEPGQRTALQKVEGKEEYKVVWSPDDELTMIKDDTDDKTTFSLLGGDGTTSGTFTKTGGFEIENNATYTAYYPSTYYGTSSWPTEQTYVAGNIPLGVPMKATGITVDESGNVSPISFKNEGGILRLNLKGTAKVTSIWISATGLDAIMLDCSKETDGYVPLKSDGVPFHIAVKAADYSGLKIEITNDAGLVCTKTLKSGNTITVQRSMITDINLDLTASSFVTPPPTKGEAPRYSTTLSETVNAPWVQLWKNGPKFAEYNVGAESTTEYGGYYCWGNPNNQSLGWTGKSGTLDVASTLWGSNWRTPTKDELQALQKKCDFTWTDDYNSTGKKGIIYTGKGAYASNSVFFLSAGYYDGSGPTWQNERGSYWSSTPNLSSGEDEEIPEGCVWFLEISEYYQILDNRGDPNNDGYSVRAVLDETPKTKGAAEVNESAGIAGNKVNWVQLWEGGPKFAEFNVGVTDGKAESYGGYYAWGGNQNKVDDHNTGTVDLSGDDDTATKLWGDKWCMPTTEDLKALLNNQNCTYTLTTQNGVYGLLCQGKEGTAYSSNSVFLPAAGYYRDGGVNYHGYDGVYWSSTPLGSDCAYDLYFDSGQKCAGNSYRTDGFSVRAVLNEAK